jgi:hypothetical protein
MSAAWARHGVCELALSVDHWSSDAEREKPIQMPLYPPQI